MKLFRQKMVHWLDRDESHQMQFERSGNDLCQSMKNYFKILWLLRVNQIMVTYPVNGMFVCLGNGCQVFFCPLN